VEKRRVYLKLTSIPEAQAQILSFPSPLTGEKVPLELACGRVLAEPAIAKVSSPAFHGAAMDGIAVQAAQTFGASQSRPKKLLLGSQAFWVNTGAPLPFETDAVIMAEKVFPADPAVDGGTAVSVEEAAFPWQHVRKIGEDLVATEPILPQGTTIGPYELGALAAAGVLEPLVFRRPRVVFIPTGSEMAPLGSLTPEALRAGQKLPEFNSLVIKALIERAGGEATIWPIVPDDPQLITAALRKATAGSPDSPDAFDLIIINAGSSAGSRDYTAGIFQELGELIFHGIQVMPGKPTALGRVNGKPALGLPGYPVSAVTSFELLAQVLLKAWQGQTPPPRPKLPVRLFQPLASRPGLEERVRVILGRVGEEVVAAPLPRGAGTVSSLAKAHGIISIPAAREGLSLKDPVEAELIKDARAIDDSILIIGSHDNSLAILDSLLREKNPRYSLASAHVGSLGGLRALAAGLCHLAGSHLLGPDGVYNQRAIQENLAGQSVSLIRLADREQGLLVKAGNPLNITGLADLARPEVTFVNRQKGSGTRVLLDWKLAELGLEPRSLNGYDDEEYTHMSVAASVAGGRAEAGLGVKAAALALGLDFLPVGVEEYDLVILDKFLQDPRIEALLSVIRGPLFRSRLRELGGYGVERTGELIWSFAG
jgi:putative molybdopterin biosynthesis protein